MYTCVRTLSCTQACAHTHTFKLLIYYLLWRKPNHLGWFQVAFLHLGSTCISYFHYFFYFIYLLFPSSPSWHCLLLSLTSPLFVLSSLGPSSFLSVTVSIFFWISLSLPFSLCAYCLSPFYSCVLNVYQLTLEKKLSNISIYTFRNFSWMQTDTLQWKDSDSEQTLGCNTRNTLIWHGLH